VGGPLRRRPSSKAVSLGWLRPALIRPCRTHSRGCHLRPPRPIATMARALWRAREAGRPGHSASGGLAGDDPIVPAASESTASDQAHFGGGEQERDRDRSSGSMRLAQRFRPTPELPHAAPNATGRRDCRRFAAAGMLPIRRLSPTVGTTSTTSVRSGCRPSPTFARRVRTAMASRGRRVCRRWAADWLAHARTTFWTAPAAPTRSSSNPHKWLFTPFGPRGAFLLPPDGRDCVRHSQWTPEFLRHERGGPGSHVRNLMDTGVQLGPAGFPRV